MKFFHLFWIIVQVLIGIHLILPLILYILHFFRHKFTFAAVSKKEHDYAIIVTAYEQTTLLPAVVNSILKLNYNNYLVYIVADNCDITGLNFNDEKVILLRPQEILSSNTKSHFYAINNFKRAHDYLTIIDSDNLVDPEYLNQLNVFFNEGFIAVQGVRQAKNLNTNYACLDEAGDMYYRFIDRKLLFEVGSSASLAGSGMAFTTEFYRECLEFLNIEGAGFDKVLQMEILNRKQRIAFAEAAVVYDEKTSKSGQLVNQRARWINTWFKYAGKGVSLMIRGLTALNWNQFVCGLVFSRPPLFIIVVLTGACILADIFFMPGMLIFWGLSALSFFLVFFIALNHFKAQRVIYSSLFKVPVFIFLQVISLFKAKKANKISTATVHYYERNIDEVDNSDHNFEILLAKNMIENKKIRILHAIRQGKVGGGETHVLDLVNQLDPDKYESVILSFTEGPMVDKLKADGFKTYVVYTEKPFNLNIWGKVKEIVLQEKIDLIHAHGTRANSNTFSSARSLKIPLIYTVHGWSFHPDQSRLVKMIRTWSERFLVGAADQTICVSQSNLNEGMTRFPMPEASVIVNGINQVKFDPNNEYKNIRAEFGIGDEVILVGYIARITAQKAPLTFLKAIANIPGSLNVKFLIVGDGDLKPQMLTLAEELKLNSRIIFVDFRSDIPDILNAIDIFCLPSLWEGLPIALLEAMAMRKAIIATAIDGTKDLVTNMENGILIPPLNVEKLAGAIQLLIDNPKLRVELGVKAGAIVKEKYNIQMMTRRIEETYKKVINGKQ
jgi:glycosyltransferase involved in cell wall biosynthesis/cellulose synthase/poly-beta-1,6-N-acetylglucosamine synthase-like glycosyltransferase